MKLPYHSLTFGADGRPTGPHLVKETVGFVTGQTAAGVTDVLVLAHGWNNDLAQAQARYDALCDHVDDLRAKGGHPAGRLAVVGLIWPSLQWADDDAAGAGGALSVGSGDQLEALRSRIGTSVDDPEVAAKLAVLAPDLSTSEPARAQFVEQLRLLLPPAHEVDDDDPPPSALLHGDPEQLLDVTGQAVEDATGGSLAGPAPTGGAQDLPPGMFPTDDAGTGDAAALGLGKLDLLDKARQVLNATTYYKMKKRSGLVADNGLVPLLEALAAAEGDLRVHLVGHSFGARLVSKAAATTGSTVSSLSLLQGAFSHRAFAADNGDHPSAPGAFRPALSGALKGPAMATHTHNDKAVGVAYAIASRLAQQAGSSLGGPDDVYGGLGANGAVATTEADDDVLGGVGTTYTFAPRRIRNLLADKTIANHGDVSNVAVANALLQLVLSTG